MTFIVFLNSWVPTFAPNDGGGDGGMPKKTGSGGSVGHVGKREREEDGRTFKSLCTNRSMRNHNCRRG